MLGEILLVYSAKKIWGVNVRFLQKDKTAETKQGWFKSYAVCRKACFIGPFYTGNSILVYTVVAAEKVIFTNKKVIEKAYT